MTLEFWWYVFWTIVFIGGLIAIAWSRRNE